MSDPTVKIQRIPEDISMDDVMKQMFHVSNLTLDRLKAGLETCEYNPSEMRAAYSDDDPGACMRVAEWCVGARGEWHLCGHCAELPEFKRFRRRDRLSVAS